MNKDVCNVGIISEICNDKIIVNIESNAACGSCAAKKMCGMSESKSKVIEIQRVRGHYDGRNILDGEYDIGNKVEVGIRTELGIRAALISYLYPSIVLLASLMIFLNVISQEWLAALLSFTIVGIYYICLSFFKKKMKDKFSFFIK